MGILKGIFGKKFQLNGILVEFREKATKEIDLLDEMIYKKVLL